MMFLIICFFHKNNLIMTINLSIFLYGIVIYHNIFIYLFINNK